MCAELFIGCDVPWNDSGRGQHGVEQRGDRHDNGYANATGGGDVSKIEGAASAVARIMLKIETHTLRKSLHKSKF